MLEPLHACNLACAGCGRIREYRETVGQRMSVAECVESVEECGAPIVSVCGGEPLIYPELEALLAEVSSPRPVRLPVYQRPPAGREVARAAAGFRTCS